MIPTTVQFFGEEEISRLNLNALTIHTRYRGHPELSETDHQNLFRHELTVAVNSGGVCAGVYRNSEVVAICAIAPLAWDTQHFGLPMAKLTVAATGAEQSSPLLHLLKETISVGSGKTGRMHLSCEVDIDDYPCLNVLLGLGAEIMDIKREYRWISQGHQSAQIPVTRARVSSKRQIAMHAVNVRDIF